MSRRGFTLEFPSKSQSNFNFLSRIKNASLSFCLRLLNTNLVRFKSILRRKSDIFLDPFSIPTSITTCEIYPESALFVKSLNFLTSLENPIKPWLAAHNNLYNHVYQRLRLFSYDLATRPVSRGVQWVHRCTPQDELRVQCTPKINHDKSRVQCTLYPGAGIKS